MSNQEGTYSNSRYFESSLELQNPVSPEDTHGHREASDKGEFLLCIVPPRLEEMSLSYSQLGVGGWTK